MILQKLNQCCGQHPDATNTSWYSPSLPANEPPETPTMNNQAQLEGPSEYQDTTPVSQENRPEPLSLRHTYLNEPLPSSQIPKHSLKIIEDVLEANIDLKGEEKQELFARN